MTPQTDRGEESKRRILEVAAEAFAEKGYAGASLNDLIRRTGLTKGAFYFHFDSKEALALEVFRAKQEQWMGRVMTRMMRHDRALDRFVEIPTALVDLIEEDSSSRSMSRLSQEMCRDPELGPKVTPQLENWVELSADLVRRAQEEGDVRADLDPVEVAETAVAGFLGIEELTEALGGGRDLRRRVDAYIRIFLSALEPTRGRGRPRARQTGDRGPVKDRPV